MKKLHAIIFVLSLFVLPLCARSVKLENVFKHAQDLLSTTETLCKIQDKHLEKSIMPDIVLYLTDMVGQSKTIDDEIAKDVVQAIFKQHNLHISSCAIDHVFSQDDVKSDITKKQPSKTSMSCKECQDVDASKKNKKRNDKKQSISLCCSDIKKAKKQDHRIKQDK